MKGIPKNNNFKLDIYENDEIITSKLYPTLKSIADDIHLDYYTTREINRMTENKLNKKFPHPTLKELFCKMKIYSIKNVINLNI